MSREENISTLNEHLDHWKRLLSEKICDQDEGEKTIDALQNAIKALEQEQCGDCIRRSDVGLTDFEIIMCNGDYREGLKILLEKIAAAPSVSPIPKMGKWIYHIDDLFPAESTMECNQCHAKQPLTCDDEFCPHCGGKKVKECPNCHKRGLPPSATFCPECGTKL